MCILKEFMGMLKSRSCKGSGDRVHTPYSRVRRRISVRHTIKINSVNVRLRTERSAAQRALGIVRVTHC